MPQTGSIGLLHICLQNILFRVAFGPHDLCLGQASHALRLRFRLCFDDCSLSFSTRDFCLRGLTFQLHLALGSSDSGLALLLRGTIGSFTLRLHSLDSRLCLIGAGLKHDRVQLADALEVGIFLRQHHMGHIKLRKCQAVLFKAGLELFMKQRGNLVYALIDL